MAESGQNLHKVPISARQKARLIIIKIMVAVAFLALTQRAAAPGLSVVFILNPEPVDAYQRLINAVIMVESAGDTLAFNHREEARGAFQIRPIRLLDYNRKTGKAYTDTDCFNYKISKEIFLYYAIKIGYPDYQTIARNWNGSGKMTQNYWEKIKKFL